MAERPPRKEVANENPMQAEAKDFYDTLISWTQQKLDQYEDFFDNESEVRRTGEDYGYKDGRIEITKDDKQYDVKISRDVQKNPTKSDATIFSVVIEKKGQISVGETRKVEFTIRSYQNNIRLIVAAYALKTPDQGKGEEFDYKAQIAKNIAGNDVEKLSAEEIETAKKYQTFLLDVLAIAEAKMKQRKSTGQRGKITPGDF